jgi:hypothetical protein
MARPQPTGDGVVGPETALVTARETLGGVRSAVAAMRRMAEEAELGLEPGRLAAIQADGRRAVADLSGLLGPRRAGTDPFSSARGLHDRCGDAIGVMAVQAGAAQAVRDLDQQRAREAVRAVQAAGTEALIALESLSRLLGEA